MSKTSDYYMEQLSMIPLSIDESRYPTPHKLAMSDPRYDQRFHDISNQLMNLAIMHYPEMHNGKSHMVSIKDESSLRHMFFRINMYQLITLIELLATDSILSDTIPTDQQVRRSFIEYVEKSDSIPF
tara:strand:+ start:806 stop:1186 length:381 start_codon:yes stop_codon:yes gene_type:complete